MEPPKGAAEGELGNNIIPGCARDVAFISYISPLFHIYCAFIAYILAPQAPLLAPQAPLFGAAGAILGRRGGGRYTFSCVIFRFSENGDRSQHAI